MDNLKIKRIIAYFIDLIIVLLIISLLSNINFLNPLQSKYDKVYKEFSQYYDEIIESISNTTTIDTENIIDDVYVHYIYKLQIYGISYTLISVVVTLLYFTCFPKFNDNRTIGKHLMKLKLVNSDNSDNVSIFKYLFRTLVLPISASPVLYFKLTNIINIALLLIKSKMIYFYLYSAISMISCILCYADILFMLSRKDNRALHDIITKTKVIEC